MKNACCRIEMFGGVRVLQEDRVTTRFRTHKAASLLAYLALNLHQNHARERLLDLFWADLEVEAGRENLSTTLTSLRRQLEPPGVPAGSVIVSDRRNVQLNPAVITTDVAEFEKKLKAGEASESLRLRADLLQEAIGLYRGELLPGCYDDWALQEQTRWSERYVGALQQWGAALEALDDLEGALQAVQHAIDADPYREEARRAQIRLLAHPDAQSPTRARARTLNGSGVFTSVLVRDPLQAAEAERLFQESIAVYRLLEDRAGLGAVLSNLGRLVSHTGRSEMAMDLFREAAEIFRLQGDRAGLANTFGSMGMNANTRGDFEAAQGYFEEYYRIAVEIQSETAQLYAAGGLARTAHQRQDWDTAETMCDQALRLVARLGIRVKTGDLLETVASIAYARGDYRRAARAFGASHHMLDMAGLNYRNADDRYKLTVASLCIALGDAEFEALYTGSRSLSWEAAVQFGLSDSKDRAES